MNKFIAASLCMFIVAACAMGGAKYSAAPSHRPAPAQTDAMGGAPSGSRSELDRLYAEVESDRAQMGLPEASGPAGAGSPQPMSLTPHPKSTTDATCKPSPSETCKTSCTLSDSICTNADKICKLADELQPDDDAATKCTKSDETCKTAHTKCCGCM